MDYYLKANTKNELWSTLMSVGIAEEIHTKDSMGNIVETSYRVKKEYEIDVIGTISQPTGNIIQVQIAPGQYIQIPETIDLDGYHANLRGPADLAPKEEYVSYVPTQEDLANTNFVMPEPTLVTTSSPLESLLVYPKTPSRVWF